MSNDVNDAASPSEARVAVASPENAARPPTVTSSTLLAQQVGGRIRRARLTLRLTQNELAGDEFSVSYISAVERGQICPSLGSLRKLADRLRVPVGELIAPEESADASPTGTLPLGFGPGDVEQRLHEAELCLHVGSPKDALNLLAPLVDRVLSLRERALVQAHRAQAYLALSRGEEAQHTAADGLALAERAGDVDLCGYLHLRLGQAYGMLGQHQAALEQYRACWAEIETHHIEDPAFQLELLGSWGEDCATTEQDEEALARFEQAEAVSRQLLHPDQLANAYRTLSVTYGQQGDRRRAMAYANRSLAVFWQAANQRRTQRVHQRLGELYLGAGRLDEALARAETAYGLADERHDSGGAADAERLLGAVYLRLQRLDEAARLAEHASTLAAKRRDRVAQAGAQLLLARVRAAQDQHAEADRLFVQILGLLESGRAPRLLRDAYVQYSDFLEHQGEGAKALEMLKKAWQLREREV